MAPPIRQQLGQQLQRSTSGDVILTLEQCLFYMGRVYPQVQHLLKGQTTYLVFLQKLVVVKIQELHRELLVLGRREQLLQGVEGVGSHVEVGQMDIRVEELPHEIGRQQVFGE